jgi:hypothetical protein
MVIGILRFNVFEVMTTLLGLNPTPCLNIFKEQLGHRNANSKNLVSTLRLFKLKKGTKCWTKSDIKLL